jgi:HTH-type transcriptional regulator/antitoxin HigA
MDGLLPEKLNFGGLNRAMDIQPIKTKRDYLRALKEVEPLMDARRGTPEGDRLDLLVTLIEAWEAKHYCLKS